MIGYSIPGIITWMILDEANIAYITIYLALMNGSSSSRPAKSDRDRDFPTESDSRIKAAPISSMKCSNQDYYKKALPPG
jgi:hypothetical protein